MSGNADNTFAGGQRLRSFVCSAPGLWELLDAPHTAPLGDGDRIVDVEARGGGFRDPVLKVVARDTARPQQPRAHGRTARDVPVPRSGFIA